MKFSTPDANFQIAASNNSVRRDRLTGQHAYPGTSNSESPGQNVMISTDSIKMTRNGNVAE
jgi:hypothetical protein